MKFIVDRKTWYRGKGSDESMLLRDDGMRCCIGFVGKQCGIDDNELQHATTVLSTVSSDSSGIHPSKWPQWFRHGTAGALSVAYSINDDSFITDTDREKKLVALFESHGDEIVFVD